MEGKWEEGKCRAVGGSKGRDIKGEEIEEVLEG